MAHLRLAAGAAMLKICEQKGVGDQFTSEQFYNLSLLMNVRFLGNSYFRKEGRCMFTVKSPSLSLSLPSETRYMHGIRTETCKRNLNK